MNAYFVALLVTKWSIFRQVLLIEPERIEIEKEFSGGQAYPQYLWITVLVVQGKMAPGGLTQASWQYDGNMI
ncbi:hypothetical protein MD273_03755 [Marinobacter pelagius]|nr:hypothetical protein [Marinobacter sp. C7]